MSTQNTTAAIQAERDQKLIDAVNRGEGRLRQLAQLSGYSSASVVKYALKRLAKEGKLVVLTTTNGARVYTGVEFARGWDLAARLAGNPDA